MAVFCTKCGKQASGTERFCTGCGAELPAVSQQAQPQQGGYQPAASQPGGYPGYQPVDQRQQSYSAPAKQSMDKKKLYMIIGGAVAVVALVVVLIIVLSGGGKKELNEANIKGKWKVTDITGTSGNNSMDFSSLLNMGAEVYMIFEDGTAKISYSVMGMSDTQTIGNYTLGNGKLTMNGTSADCTIEGSTMTIKDGSTTMKLKKQ